MKMQRFSYENVSTSRAYGFRGQRNHCWPLISSIQRDLPGCEEQKATEMEKRVRILALFSEALQRAFSEIEPTELECVAIAQHYGIASPLCDLSWSPWVALFFASDGGLTGDVGIVQCFSISNLTELMGHGKSLFGTVRIVEVKFVPRITAQQGFFLELPGHRLDKQMIPFSQTFEQHDGLVFEDEHLDITRSQIYPSAAEDRFAAFANPVLKTYPFIPLHLPLTGADYFFEAKKWYPEQFSQVEKDIESLGLELCEFHCRLQAEPSLRDYERSFTRLKTALSLIFSSLNQGQQCTMTELVEYYVSQAGDESQKVIMKVWKTMNVSHTD
jgi:FRG domain